MRFHKIIGHMNGRCRSPIMSFNIQGRSCHAERSEASLCPSREPLRFAEARPHGTDGGCESSLSRDRDYDFSRSRSVMSC